MKSTSVVWNNVLAFYLIAMHQYSSHQLLQNPATLCVIQEGNLILIHPALLGIISDSILAKTGDGQNNGNTRQDRNKTLCVGCTERIL